MTSEENSYSACFLFVFAVFAERHWIIINHVSLKIHFNTRTKSAINMLCCACIVIHRTRRDNLAEIWLRVYDLRDTNTQLYFLG